MLNAYPIVMFSKKKGLVLPKLQLNPHKYC